jgi:8-oxo-dGTP pyrophosphatase MutT (NUDIX family)
MINIGGVANSLLLAFLATSSNDFSTIWEKQQPTPISNKIMTDERTEKINQDVITNLRSLGMEKKELKRHSNLRRASILIPLFERSHNNDSNNNYNNNNIDDDVISDNNRNNTDESASSFPSSNIHVLFTQRVSNMTSHGGEVCFPGGRQDIEDCHDDVQTALREASEEVGLQHQHIECIARMESVESKHSLCVTPIIGLIHPPSNAEPSGLKVNAKEVEVAFAVPLHYFANPKNCHSVEKYKWKGGNVLIRTYMYNDFESGRQFKIWGLTAHVIHAVAKVAFGNKIKSDCD